MKRKILPLFMAILVFITSFFTPQTFAALQALPVPQPPIEHETNDTDLFTGSAAYSYPIKVPKGTNDLTPDVSISYNSSGAKNGSQVVGLGWEVSRDYVERDLKYTIDNSNDDSFKLHFKGKTYELVYVESEDTYHTKIESNLRVKNIGSGSTNTYGMYWEVTDKNGTKYRFGYQTQSELACTDRYHAKQWNVDLVTDTHDNKIYYNYTESNGLSYLDTIKYNNDQQREIDFNYTTITGRKMYLQACNTQETSKLTNITVKANSNIIHGYNFDYTTNASTMQLLSSITETGTSSSSALPATVFDYKPQIPSFQETDEKWLNNQQYDYTDLDHDETTLVDVNGDTLPDIVRTYGGSTWKVGLNTGSTWSSLTDWITSNPFDTGLEDSYVRLMDVTGDGLPDIVRAASSTDWRVYRNTGTSWNTTSELWGIPSVHSSVNLSSSNVQLVDVTGDGLPDVVRSWWNGARQWEVLKNTGSSWSSSADVWSYGGIADDVGEDDVLIADANGDGLADLIKTTYSGTNATWSVYKNTGSGWATTPDPPWINNANIDAHLEKNNVTLADVNGDGLNDIVKIIDQGSNDKWDVLFNTGNSWSTVWQTWVSGVDADVEGEDNVVLSDANGDSMPDIVKSSQNSGGNVTWQVWKNNGEAPDLLSSVKTSQGGVIGFNYKASGQFDNTGADSVSDLPFSTWVVDYMTNNNGMPGAQATNDITTYTYQDGLYDWQDREMRGFAVVDTVEPDLSKKKYVFNQSDALQGTIAEVQTRDSSNNPYGEIENTWDTYLNNGIYTVNLAEEKEYTYDGTASNPKIRQTDYQYDNYGNVIKKSELGDTSVSGDERYTYNEFVYNPTAWIMDKLSHTSIKSANDSTTVSEKWQYYDNDPLASASASAPTASKFGDGSDGNITISSNTTEAPLDATITLANAGNNIATVSALTNFAVNQLVLLHQSQGSNAGDWEIARIQSIGPAMLRFTTNLTHSYTTSGVNRAQIRVIPQYHNVSVNSGTTWSPKAWNGSTGGIMAFLSNGTATISGTISATGKGFRLSGSSYNQGAIGYQGEGSASLGFTSSNAANGNGGGGGGGNIDSGHVEAGHGGGGGNGTAGQTPGTRNTSPPGTGGSSTGTADLATMTLGGAGGEGGNGWSSGDGRSGGAGGGIIFIVGAATNVSGAIVSAGENGTNSNDRGGTGGGGAGGSILLKSQTATLGSGVAASGGSGGVGTGAYSGNGGNGGSGRIRVQYETSLSGTTSPTASTNQSTISTVPAGNLTWSGASTNLTKGDLTKEVKWLSGGTNPQTNYEYDSYGNLTKSIDPNSNQTTYTYNINDSTRTYPERITNAKSQQTNFTYDLGTGNILTKTDANNLTVTYTYDNFSRIAKEIQPYDNSTYPTKQYTYLNDGIAPEGTLMALREVGGVSGTLDVYTLVDGFGRKVQTRRDAEDSSKQIVQDTYYDPTGEVKKESVPYLASSSAAMIGVTPTPPPATKFGDGSDGDVAITSTITETPIDSSVTATASTTTASVNAGLAFKPNNIVLFHQTQGINAGQWEFARVASYSGTTLTMTTGLTNSYSSSSNNRAQVRVVKQYDNVTVHSGGTWRAKEWDGSTGGIFAFLAKGIVTVSGTITANGGQGATSTAEFSPGGTGGGFRGGQGHRPPSSSNVNAWVGEGTGGSSFQLSGSTPQSTHNGNGGGAPSFNTGLIARAAAGGGNGASGGSTDPATGGDASGSADLTTMTLGGGGGGGARGYQNGTGTAGGGSGGGIILVRGATVRVTGALRSNGGNGGVDGNNNHANGGGGAGGSILINAQVASSSAGFITATGGQGYQGGGSGGTGTGGVGRIRIAYETSLSGIATPSASTAQVTIPTIAAGTVPSDPGAYGVYQAPDATAKSTEYTYDTLGRVNMVRNPNGDLRTTAYDHWKETDIDENGHIKRRYLNAYEKISKVEEVIDFSTHATNYLYNTLDQLTQTIDAASNSGTMTYDTLGRKVSQTDPDMGIWTYAYDAADNLTSSTDARDIPVGRTYDELNRLTTVNYPNDTDLGFTYDVNKIGTLSIATDSAGTVSYTYDNRLRKTAETRVIGGVSKTTTFAYDSADRMTNQTNPDSTQSNYTFNNQGEIETLGGILDDIDYNALGKITEKEFDNGLTTSYTYSTDDFRLNRIQTGALQDLNYTYDSVGNITSIEDDVASKTKLFSYDDLDRLSTASESGGFNFAYEYNPIGNLTKFTSASTEIDYTYGAGNAGPHALTSASGTASGSAETELLDGLMTLAASSGEDVGEENVASTILNGKTTVKVNLDLNGEYFGLGDDEASVVFIQGGEWMAANIIPYAKNGYDGIQTIEVPLSAFYKVNDTEQLNTAGTVSGLRVRFWNDEPFSVNVSSIKVIDGSEPTEMELLINPWSFVEASSGDEVKYHDIPAYSIKGKTTARVTFDLHGTSFGLGDDEASVVFTQGGEWMGANLIPYANNGQNGPQTVDIPLTAFEKVFDTEDLDTNADVDQILTRFWNDEPFTVDVTSIKVLSDEEEEASGSANIAPNGTGYRWSQNTSSTSNSNRVAASGINDEVMNVDVELNGGSDDNANAWEAAGVTWSASQSAITRVDYTNGTWVAEEDGNGVFTQNFKLQFTTDGTTWTDSGWTSSPAYAHDSSAAGGATYTFSGNADNIKGARVVGQVRTGGASWHAHAYELKVFQGTSTETNISGTGSGYRWSQNASASSNANRVAATGMNDGNEAVDVDLNNGSDDNENAWEGAGITWAASQSAVTKVEYINGTWDGNNNGAFTANFKLQFTTDGTTWTDSGWSSSPSYDHDNSAASGKKYTFTGSPMTIRGARVVGQVRTGGANSWHAFARELKVYTSTEETSGGPIEYDASGNMISEDGKCYEYNQANQLSTVKNCDNNQTIAEYVYDYKGQRIVKENYTNGTLSSTVISWSNSFETKDIVGGATETTNYYFANNEVVAKKDNSGNKVYFHNDHLGSNALTTNQAGSLVENVTYDPWGQVLGAATQSKYQYTGQEKDDETGLNYYDARYYDPELRRFTQPDTIIQNVYDPQSLNRYSYARNNPLRYTDPTGHAFWDTIVNTVKQATSAVQSFFSPPKAPSVYSAPKLPANNAVFQQPITKSYGSSGGGSSGGGNASINVLGVSGNASVPTGEDPFFKEVRQKGHVAIGGTTSIARFVSAGGGVKLSRNGTTDYISGGGGADFVKGLRVGGTALLSTKSVQQNAMSVNATVALGLAVQYSVNPENVYDLTKWQLEAVGIGCCGADISGEYTGVTRENADYNAGNFRSKEWGDIYGH